MDAYERVMHRISGKPVDFPPNFNIMMTFAAHYIGQPLSKYYLDYRVLCDANFAVLEAFDLDLVQAISDPYREAADLGAEIEFPKDGLPISTCPLLVNEADFAKLKPVAPEQGQRMSDRLQAIEYFRRKVGGEVPIMGWVEGALAEAADLRGVSNLMLDLFERPEWVKEILGFLVEIEIAFARAQINAGADIIGLGDAIASQISPAMYLEFALPYEQRIFAAVIEMGAIPRLHICGNTTGIIPFMPQSGARIVDLDWMVDFEAVAQQYQDDPVLCGNFDPVELMLKGTPEQVRKATLHCLRVGGNRCISMAGCEIPDRTPHANLKAQAEALRDWRF